MISFLKRIFSKKDGRPDDEGDDEVIVASDDDRLLMDALAKASNLDFFKGHVEHGYSLTSVKNEDQCPRCNAPTRRQYANFIYNNQVKPRVLAAPAGYFCTKCNTVIVDEKLMRKGATPGFDYLGTLGLSYDDNRPPDIFSTWNGKPFDFILGEAGDLFSHGNAYSPQRWEKIKRKKQMAKTSRKRNRRK